jgi:hypothetical protein
MTENCEIDLTGLSAPEIEALFAKQERGFECEAGGVACTGVVERITWRRYSFPGEHAVFRYEVSLLVANSWHYTFDLRYEANGLYSPSSLWRRSASGAGLAHVALPPGKATAQEQFAFAVERCVAHYKANSAPGK